MENDPFIDDVPIRTSIYKGFSIAMLNNQMVSVNDWTKWALFHSSHCHFLPEGCYCEQSCKIDDGWH